MFLFHFDVSILLYLVLGRQLVVKVYITHIHQ